MEPLHRGQGNDKLSGANLASRLQDTRSSRQFVHQNIVPFWLVIEPSVYQSARAAAYSSQETSCTSSNSLSFLYGAAAIIRNCGIDISLKTPLGSLSPWSIILSSVFCIPPSKRLSEFVIVCARNSPIQRSEGLRRIALTISRDNVGAFTNSFSCVRDRMH